MPGPEFPINSRLAGKDDPRLDTPAFHRNRVPVLEAVGRAMTPWMEAGRAGDVLEVGSGSGQHVMALGAAFPSFTWWPSDREARHLESIEAWRDETGLENVRPAALVDAAVERWDAGPGGADGVGDLAGILVINVLHIAPIAVTTGILAAAGRRLAPGGRLMIYGPFLIDGHFNAESNKRFDTDLKARDPAWGLRDAGVVTVRAQAVGLSPVEILPMPANNLFLIFEKSAA